MIKGDLGLYSKQMESSKIAVLMDHPLGEPEPHYRRKDLPLNYPHEGFCLAVFKYLPTDCGHSPMQSSQAISHWIIAHSSTAGGCLAKGKSSF